MCHQVTYTLACEHVRTQIIYCADATVESSAGTNASSGSSKSSSSAASKSSASSKSKQQHKASHSSKPSKSHHHNKAASVSPPSSKPPSSAATPLHKRPCANLSVQSLPYPTPPSFAANPASFSSSPLSPRCPLRDCPFEQKNRCWNCCWCGKGWNETGRCSCVMLIEGNEVRCEHICCPQCEAAGGEGSVWEAGGFP
ncbi:hypothetical protein QBC46DRAFT_270864 [Diplogelasinospora grovesii]|uniref:Uncharacterized protein n=1 Tax=Diplogelasinospora grovesii TaxID=303347 RepID=A0AAN6S118_9PEZI|nr:hypothetical protein QBC46DRAFT_270864 [Diplogelasinospora grovesii]